MQRRRRIRGQEDPGVEITPCLPQLSSPSWALWDWPLEGPSNVYVAYVCSILWLTSQATAPWLVSCCLRSEPLHLSLFLIHAIRLFSFVGLIQIPVHDSQHSTSVRGPNLLNMVNVAVVVLRSFCNEKNKSWLSLSGQISWGGNLVESESRVWLSAL